MGDGRCSFHKNGLVSSLGWSVDHNHLRLRRNRRWIRPRGWIVLTVDKRGWQHVVHCLVLLWNFIRVIRRWGQGGRGSAINLHRGQAEGSQHEER